MIYPNRLKIIRVIRGMKQVDLSFQVKIDRSKLSYIENGYLLPKEEEKIKLAEALGVKVKDLFPIS